MRVLLAAFGSRGDVQPMIALGQALRAAGHGVVISAPPDFEGWARCLGFDYFSAGDSVEALLRKHGDALGGNPVRALSVVREIAVREAPGWFERTLEAARGADLIVSANQFVARSVAEYLRVPCAGAFFCPTFLRSSHHAPIAVQWQRLPRWMNSLAWTLNDGVIERMLQDSINAGRARLGLAPVAAAVPHFFRGIPLLLAADPWLAPPAPDWGQYDVTATGPWFYDDPEPLDADVESFLAVGPAPVFVGFGSMVAKDSQRATEVILEGIGERRVLIAKGWAGLGGRTLPPSAMLLDRPVPHAKLFPRVSAVVHHGGAGTVATALRAGVPQVIVPHLMDQHYWADRLLKLGLAPEPIKATELSAAHLARALEKATALLPAARLHMAQRLNAQDGRQLAVAALEKFR